MLMGLWEAPGFSRGEVHKVDSILNDTMYNPYDDVNYLHRDYTLPDFLRDYTTSASNADTNVNTNSSTQSSTVDDNYIQVSVVDDTDTDAEIIDAEIVDD